MKRLDSAARKEIFESDSHIKINDFSIGNELKTCSFTIIGDGSLMIEIFNLGQDMPRGGSFVLSDDDINKLKEFLNKKR